MFWLGGRHFERDFTSVIGISELNNYVNSNRGQVQVSILLDIFQISWSCHLPPKKLIPQKMAQKRKKKSLSYFKKGVNFTTFLGRILGN